MTEQTYPTGWNEQRVRRVLEHYEGQTDEQAAAEDDATAGEARSEPISSSGGEASQPTRPTLPDTAR